MDYSPSKIISRRKYRGKGSQEYFIKHKTDRLKLCSVNNNHLQPHELQRNHLGSTAQFTSNLSQIAILTSIVIVFISTTHIQYTFAAIGECNFEKYATGCFSQANFICDPDTNLCKCHPETPILIDQRFCLKKAKPNEICQSNEQCDTANGFYCTYSDYRFINSSDSSTSDTSYHHRHNKETQTRCRSIKVKHKHNNSSKYLSSSPTSSQSQQQSNKLKSSSTISNFHSLIWIFLIACLFGLIVLLLLIKSQYQHIRHNRHPFQQAEDRVSINSEVDVPPPYEVAIRMKI